MIKLYDRTLLNLAEIAYAGPITTGTHHPNPATTVILKSGHKLTVHVSVEDLYADMVSNLSRPPGEG